MSSLNPISDEPLSATVVEEESQESSSPPVNGAGGLMSILLQHLRLSPERGTLRFRFQHGISWNVVGAIINNGANFLTNVAIANLLGRELFGGYGMVQSTLTTFVGIAQAAGGITATRYVSEFRATNKERAGRILGLCAATTAITGLVCTCLILSCTPWLARTTLHASFLIRPLQIGAAVIFFTVVNAYQMGALAGLESYREWAIANGLQGPVQLGICGLLTWRWGLQGAVTGLLATAAIRWLILHIALRREANKQGINVNYSGLWQERVILFRFALPAALSSLSAAPAIWLGNTFLIHQVRGYSQLALFSAALNLKNVVLFLPMLMNNVGTSLLNNHRDPTNRLQYRKIFWTNATLTASAVLGGAVVVGLGRNYLLRLYGKTFPEGREILLVLLCAAIVETVAMSFYQVIQSEEKMWLSLLAVMLPRDIALAAFAYWLTPAYGALGLGLSHLIAWILCSTVILIVVSRMSLSPQKQPPPLLGVLPMVNVYEGDA